MARRRQQKNDLASMIRGLQLNSWEQETQVIHRLGIEVSWAKIADVMISGTGVESSNYTAGSSGWMIDGDGNAEFNNVTIRDALYIMPSGTSFPVSPEDGELFHRTDQNIIYRYDAGNTQWLPLDYISSNLRVGATVIDTANIVDLAVEEAKIGDLAVTNAKINDLNATKINAGTLSVDRIGSNSLTMNKIELTAELVTNQLLRSSNYVANTSGWQIEANGDAEFNDVEIRGDLISGNWNGTDPPNLSSEDTGATAGWALDSSVGAAQFEGNVYVGGTISCSGTFQTGTASQYIKISGGSAALIELDSSLASSPGEIQVNNTGGPWSGLHMHIHSPRPTAGASLGSDIYLGDAKSRIDIGPAHVELNLVGSYTKFEVISDGTTEVQIQADDGSVSRPTYGFSTDQDVGMYLSDTAKLAFSVGGVQRMEITTTRVIVGGGDTGDPILAHAPSVSTPAFAFQGDVDTGFYRIGAGNLGYASNGALRVDFGQSFLTATNGTLANGNPRLRSGTGAVGTPVFTFYGDEDTGIWRRGANRMGFGANGQAYLEVNSNLGGSGVGIGEDLDSIGDHEVLRANRTASGTDTTEVGYYSSWAAEKNYIKPLGKAREHWKREWFMDIVPVTYRRKSAKAKKAREFGFTIENLTENTIQLTTGGDKKIGDSPSEYALLAVIVDYVQYLEGRVAALEAA